MGPSLVEKPTEYFIIQGELNSRLTGLLLIIMPNLKIPNPVRALRSHILKVFLLVIGEFSIEKKFSTEKI